MTTYYNDALSRYISEHFAADPVLERIYAEIPRRGLPAITIQPEEGRFLQLLAAVSGARRAVEIGTLGGYSGAWIARGLPVGGKLITLEREPHHAEVAWEHFRLAGVAEKVELRLGDARVLLPALAKEGPFDFCFIDAEKSDYDRYLDWAVANVRPGGVIAAHNAFQGGGVVGGADRDEQARTMRAFNRRFAREPRLLSTIFPAGDGMLIGMVAEQ
jgi:caffeoyl-CoA O-methyltransferase